MSQSTTNKSTFPVIVSNKYDILNRQPLIERITNILHTISKTNGTCTLALNGQWGSGKTFLLEMIENQLKEKAYEKYLIFKYNCWQYDFYEEPLVALIASLLDSIREYQEILSKDSLETISLVLNVALEVFGKFLENKIGYNPVEHAQNALKTTEDESREYTKFDTYSDLKEGIDSMRAALGALAEKHTIILVVDEVDRCIPPYAIKVLERLHHLFSGIPNIIVIIAVDKSQLEHSICQLFGPETNTEKYLQKFINFEINLDCGTIYGGFEDKFREYVSLFDALQPNSTFNFNHFVSALFSGIDIRRMERIMEKVRITHLALFPSVRKDYSFMCFELMCGVLDLFYELHNYGEIKIIPSNNNRIEYSVRYFENEIDRGDREINTKEGINTTFLKYLNDECSFTTHQFTQNNKLFHSPDTFDIPQILAFYLCRMYHDSDDSPKYIFNNNCPNLDILKSNTLELRDFKHFLMLMQ